ncbi:pleiotropic drug resistance protein 1-like [Capsicum annuum]|uniref:pleiotropic drug resistance protein 1-like n=1 Tax=Capsicum annuum TaxID=4072 RepID=UPI001FB076A3|nr:pleiotropic drug resistance protein 1-like [Capsicum annuum]
MACLWKQHQLYWRNPTYTAVRFLFTVFIALGMGTMFWDLGTKVGKSQDLFNDMGSMYAHILFLGLQHTSAAIPVVAVVFIEIPYIFVQAVFYGVIVYAMIGFKCTITKFFRYLFVMFFTLLYFTFKAMMSIAVAPNQNIAHIVSLFFYAMWNLFSGFIVPRPHNTQGVSYYVTELSLLTNILMPLMQNRVLLYTLPFDGSYTAQQIW